jgi:hypothetical protein
VRGHAPPEKFEKMKALDAFWCHFGTEFGKIFLLKFSYILCFEYLGQKSHKGYSI